MYFFILAVSLRHSVTDNVYVYEMTEGVRMAWFAYYSHLFILGFVTLTMTFLSNLWYVLLQVL